MILDKLILLRNILIERLPNIKRWENVGIFFKDDVFPKDTINPDNTEPSMFYILWYNSKKKENLNPYEYKTLPLNVDDIDAVIKRQREKLRTESEKT